MSVFAAAMMICLAPSATDGDTLKCANQPARIRLFAVESEDKTELDASNKVELTRLSTGGVVCEVKAGSYHRVVAQCFNAWGQDLGKALLDAKRVHEWCSYSTSRAYPNGYYGTCKP
jgi:endonuclease YncB( thermonuclease family)